MALSVKLEVFEGPLDLLLHLIEKNKIDIYDIPIVEVTDQYLEYIRQMEHEDMNVMSEFLVMAATLLDIKCRMLLPKEVNQSSLAIQHHEESSDVMLKTVADASGKTGQIEMLDEGQKQDVTAVFPVDNFSVFTVTWKETFQMTLHYVNANGQTIVDETDEIALATYDGTQEVTLSDYANRITHTEYIYDSAYINFNGVETTIQNIKYDDGWKYKNGESVYSDWIGAEDNVDVYLKYTEKQGNDTAPPESNIYPVDAINVWDTSANIILVYPYHFNTAGKDIGMDNIVNLNACLPAGFPSASTVQQDWTVYRIENRQGRYQVVQYGSSAVGTTGVTTNDSYLLLVKNSYLKNYKVYVPTAD